MKLKGCVIQRLLKNNFKPKTKTKMKTIIKSVAFSLLFGAGLLTSCENNANHDKDESSKDVAEQQNEDKFNNKADEKDAQFVVDVVAANYDEIKFANFGLSKSMNDEIKTLAKQMITDHTKAVNSLKEIAAAKMISVPGWDSTNVDKKMENWNDKKPADFDRDWTNEMIDMHKNTVDKLEGRQKDTTDPEIRGWIDSTLPTVRSHLDMLNQCKDKLK